MRKKYTAFLLRAIKKKAPRREQRKYFTQTFYHERRKMSMSTYEKAACLLAKLYLIRRTDVSSMEIEDIIAKASPAEIDFYYRKIIRGI